MRVMIVDDEVVIRDGLRALIDWQAAGFDEVIDAKNAMDAMDKMERTLPDLIITDIFMPEISGLDFAKRIRSRYPSIRFVILTGYEKFEYAKEAIEIGVAKYLVKPIFPDELRQTVEELREEMMEESQNRDWNESARQRLHRYKPIITDKFWNDLLTGALSKPEEISIRAEAADVQLLFPVYSCAAIQIYRLEQVYARYGERDLPLVRFAIRNIVEEIHGSSVIHVAEHSQAVLLCLLSEPVRPEEWKRTAEAIERTLKIAVGVGAGKPRTEPVQVRLSAAEALETVRYLAMLDRTGFIGYEDIPARNQDHVEYPYEEEKLLLESIRYQDRVTEQSVTPFMLKLSGQNPSPEELHLAFVQLLGALYRLADEYGMDTIPTYQESVSRLEQMLSYQQMQHMLQEMIQEIEEHRSASTAGLVSQLVERARLIIQDRYRDSTLSVAQIARILCITPNYLSRIFHQKTGTTCVEFITECRLEEAKRLLLHTPFKNYEIAEKVGYTNPHYFSFMFKKNVGRSPSEFRESARGKG
jgi:two-component system, response regulator YesN